MMKFCKSWPITLSMIGIGLFAVAPPARAGFMVRATDATGAVVFFIVEDNMAGDLNPAPNVITVISGTGGVPNLAGFALNVDTAFTNAPGGPVSSVLDLTYTLVSQDDVGGTVRIETSATGFTFPSVAGNPVTLTSDLAGFLTGGGGSVTAQQWLNTSDTLFGLGPFTPGPQGPFGGGAIADEARVSGDVTGTFSLTESVTFNLAASSIAMGSFTSEVTPVPEPASILLVLTGLPVLGVCLRRLRKA